MIGIAIPILFLGNFVNGVATPDHRHSHDCGHLREQQRPISKFIYPACVLAHIWPGFLPTGGNAAGYLQYNTILENLGGVGTFEFFSMMINKIPIEIIVIPFVILVTLKMAPDLGNIPSKGGGSRREPGSCGKQGQGILHNDDSGAGEIHGVCLYRLCGGYRHLRPDRVEHMVPLPPSPPLS